MPIDLKMGSEQVKQVSQTYTVSVPAKEDVKCGTKYLLIER